MRILLLLAAFLMIFPSQAESKRKKAKKRYHPFCVMGTLYQNSSRRPFGVCVPVLDKKTGEPVTCVDEKWEAKYPYQGGDR